MAERFRKYRPEDYDPELVQIFFDRYYQDRGMTKWQGYFLSDHTTALKQQAKEQPPVLKSKMTQEDIGVIMFDAWTGQQHVTIQLDQIDGEKIPVQIDGYVTGTDDNSVYFMQDDGQSLSCELEDVRNIFVTPEPEKKFKPYEG